MSEWRWHVEVADIFNNKDFSLHERAVRVASRIRASAWYWSMGGDKGWLECLVKELEQAEDADNFDWVWDAIYDEADKDRAWIETYIKEDHQNERRHS